jgi:two-component system response regulator DegU
MKLLIVEDNESMRGLMVKLLCDLVSSVHECSDGREALAAYQEHRPDWVLMDIEMGQVDGLEATRLITAAFPEARICIVTNYDDEELREAAQRAGAREYVLKDQLLDVRRVLIAANST